MTFLESIIGGFVIIAALAILASVLVLVEQYFGDAAAGFLTAWLVLSVWIWLFSNAR